MSEGQRDSSGRFVKRPSAESMARASSHDDAAPDGRDGLRDGGRESAGDQPNDAAREAAGAGTATPPTRRPRPREEAGTQAGIGAAAAEPMAQGASGEPAAPSRDAAAEAAPPDASGGASGGDGRGDERGGLAGAARRLQPPRVGVDERDRLLRGDHAGPHSILGAHPATVAGRTGAVIRAMQPDAVRAEAVLEDGTTHELEREWDQLFSGFVPDVRLPLRYRLRFHFHDGGVWERDDAYRFMPTLGELDLHLFAEGNHRRLWTTLGAHIRTIDGVEGVAFAVWAPNARRVSVVGDFCGWDGRVFPMRVMGASGVWELFIPGLREDALYKYEIRTREGAMRVKTDPFAFKMQQAPETASIVVREDGYRWKDEAWMSQRRTRDTTREPMAIYEVHIGSWARVHEEGDRTLTYAELAPRLAEHCRRHGFTHVEFLPVSEHPFYGSWGYQVSGYYAPSSRYGTPDEFRQLVDALHQAGIGVIIDWVPAHFPKDDYALRRFDGTALFEHEDPRLGEHPDWGTLIFNYGRREVRNFLVANALYWLLEFHVDALRVDAVASMLYLDYSRQPGQWLRNRLGGRENLDAIDFLRMMNEIVHAEAPGCFTVAEESTAWPGVTKPVSEGGLGFTYKWNMGWMHDTLSYFQSDPIYRQFKQDTLTFAMMYEYTERFIMPLSHDEVVHLKKSMLGKMPGDEWQKFANLRALMGYQYTRPGKKLLFMGTELAVPGEWNHDVSLDWRLAEVGLHGAFRYYMERLGAVYKELPALWQLDSDWRGFQWIDVNDRANSVLSYVRCSDDDHAIVVLNLTPIPRDSYRLGAPSNCRYHVALNSDAPEFGGAGYALASEIQADDVPFHGFGHSVRLNLPPLSMVVLRPEKRGGLTDDMPPLPGGGA